MAKFRGGLQLGGRIPHGLRPGFVIHLHGAVVPPIYDSNPGTTAPLTPGEHTRRVYHNRQRPMLLWYHDHSMGQTAGTVYAGLAALYVIRGPAEQALERARGLPRGARELLLVLQDKSFERDARCQLTEL